MTRLMPVPARFTRPFLPLGLLALLAAVITIVGRDGTPATVLRIVRAGLLLLVAGLLAQRTLMVIRA
ncbi:hypothetical protein CLM82_00985, partial [Streptomyces albidoflavus]